MTRGTASSAELQAVADGDISADAGSNIGEQDKADLAWLASLPPLEYDRVRKDEAQRLGIRAETLDREVAARRPAVDSEGNGTVVLADPEPWEHPVNGAGLLNLIAGKIRAHIVLPTGAEDAMALWVVHTHAHAAASISPILAITSPTPECGKTTTLSLIGAMVPRPLPASNITAAALFRSVEKWQPTLLIDEADTFLKDSDELRGVVNSGHSRSSAFVIRTTGEDHEPRQFSTWSAKAIALIGKLPPTLESRAIPIELRRLGAGETVDPLRGDRLAGFEPIRRMAWRWAQDHLAALRDADPKMPPNLRGRTADNWRPLIAIADAAGGDWPSKARQAAEALSAGRTEATAGIMLLDDIRELFAERDADRLTSAEIVEALGKREDRPWSEWRNDKPITTRQLARLLEPFAVAPTTIRDAGRVAKGYLLSSFADAFRRYSPSQSVTPLQTPEISHSGELRSVTALEPCNGSNGAANQQKSANCNGVTDEIPPSGEEGGDGVPFARESGDRPRDLTGTFAEMRATLTATPAADRKRQFRRLGRLIAAMVPPTGAAKLDAVDELARIARDLVGLQDDDQRQAALAEVFNLALLKATGGGS